MGAYRPEGLEEGLVVDMGGASTELVRFKGDLIENMISLSFGSLYLYKRYVARILPDKRELKHIRRFVRKQLSTVEWLGPSGHACLIGGTARAIARLHRELNGREQENLQGYCFDAEDFDRMLGYLAAERKVGVHDIVRVAPERAHTILPGLTVFSELVRFGECATVSISRSGVREGYIREYALKEAPK